MKKHLYLITSLLLLSACNKQNHYYLLPIDQQPKITQSAPSINTSIKALRHLRLPDYLYTPFILYYEQDGSINRDRKRRWASYPDDNIRLYLENQLRAQYPTLYSYPLPENIKAQHIIDLEINEMIADAQSQALHYKSTIHHSHNNTTNTTEKNGKIPLNSLKAQDIIEAHAQALQEIAQTITHQLQQKD